MSHYYIYLDFNSGFNQKISECVLFDLNDKKIYDCFLNKNNRKIINDCSKIYENNDYESYEEYLVSYPENEVIPINFLQFQAILNSYNRDVIYLNSNDFFKTFGLEEWLI